eukprot:TRINITY_DN5758_c0_g1_i2.p1 TRINITY_DN5758_c0_g1~~TRINITY_DN5758_c0_g1_i2.p1  ORF type:complete len:152 (+),score=10.96 TRINITY_DN5758_c0_g1_i2:64-456(+)
MCIRDSIYVGIWDINTTNFSNVSYPTWENLAPQLQSVNDPLIMVASYYNGTNFDPPIVTVNYSFIEGRIYSMFYAGICEYPSEHAISCLGNMSGPIHVRPYEWDQITMVNHSQCLSIVTLFLIAFIVQVL